MNTDLPVHPRTGLRAVGIGKRGPIWPIAGAEDNPPAPPNPAVPEPPKPGPTSGPTPTPTPPEPPAGDPPKEAAKEEPLGEGGIKALQAERDARKALEKKLEGLAPLEKLAAALGATGGAEQGKTEIEQITERLANHEKQLAEANEARWRAEVANAKKLTPEQAAELRGSTAEELAAHADRLLALFPTAPASSGTPRPDPSQGGQGGAPPNLDALIAEATKKGDIKAVLRLQNQKLVTS
ncbi:hypothetical protein [Amycolatopsis rubida]|uniref:DUF4355 domain-containing protein n=1 Tax=Amycolatopsis rubida TaxID=112413 RepID=A0A1I5IHK6_9PSEU|nr:hypothetical protein [Amycolatopsis rubida]SFO59902.1 hypothetical protein SAMN05421854_102468 [Amycolatopsis rubida]